MKLLALTLVTGAATLHGSAFFGIWTAPGLDIVPTYAELSGQEEQKTDENGRPVEEPGIFPIAEMDSWLPFGVELAGD